MEQPAVLRLRNNPNSCNCTYLLPPLPQQALMEQFSELDWATWQHGELSIAEQQFIEIGKGLSVDAKIYIFDEPTAALNGPESERLFELINALRAEGIDCHTIGDAKEPRSTQEAVFEGAQVARTVSASVG